MKGEVTKCYEFHENDKQQPNMQFHFYLQLIQIMEWLMIVVTGLISKFDFS